MRLGEVCDIIAGQSPPGDTYRDEPSGLPFFQGKADFGSLHPVPRTWCVVPSKVAEPGDILISVRAPVGPTNVANTRCCIGRGLAAIRPRSGMDRDYVLFALRHFEDDLAALGSGSTFSAIGRRELESLVLPVPPLLEQKRIAAALREQLDAAARMRAAAEVLDGEVKSLAEAHIRKTFESPACSAAPAATIGDVASLVIDGPHVTPIYVDQGVPFVTVRNIVNRVVDFTETRFITAEDHARFSGRGRAEVSDILYTKDGTLGIPCLVQEAHKFSFFVSVALIKLRRNLVDPRYVAYALDSPSVRSQVETLAAGAGLKHMVLRSIRALSIPLPSLDFQRLLVAELSDRLRRAHALAETAERQVALTAALPPALLRRAFSGGL